MRNPLRFFVELFKQPLWIPLWVLFLVLVNVASVGFWESPVAKVILITFFLNSILMMGLYSRFGFEKILGLGHVFWIPLVVYLLVQIPDVEGGFQVYLMVLLVSIAISLVFDIVDVRRYFWRRQNDALIRKRQIE